MKKSRFFTAVITLVLSAIILFVIIRLIFNNSELNQGNYMVSDALLTSIVELEDKSLEIDDWCFDISQSNKISMLIDVKNDSQIKEIYLEKVKIKSSNNVGIYIEQEEYGLKYKYKNMGNNKINIYAEMDEDGNYLVEFDIKNEDAIVNFNVPEGTKEIRHDGTILSLTNSSIKDIELSVKYNLVIVENQGQLNTCKVKLVMPDEKLITDGIFVERLNNSNFSFKVKY